MSRAANHYGFIHRRLVRRFLLAVRRPAHGYCIGIKIQVSEMSGYPQPLLTAHGYFLLNPVKGFSG